MQGSIALLALVALVAGCVDPGHASTLDTGPIPPDGTARLTFTEAGTFALHCHPHPFMRHNVTVAPSGSVAAHVHIEDGNTTEAYRFLPETLIVRSGAVVEYHNHGRLPHTATLQTH